jgi:demethylmenaquinone methyltransferase/2-methoxy-6-polyprenyl-1,4-benzoquinol methylase
VRTFVATHVTNTELESVMGSLVGPHRAEPPGLLITRVRGYNLIVALFFAGRRRAVNTALVAASGASPGDRVLDVGCGPGHLARMIAAAVGPQGQVVGVDPSTQMINYARKHAGGLANCRFEVAAAQSLESPDEAFDVVTSTFAMHHIPPQARAAAMAHMYRVLRPGGHLLIADMYPTGRLVPAVIRALTRIAPQHRLGPSHDAADLFAELDVRRYTDALRAAGFTAFRHATVRPWTGYLTATKPG